MRRYLPFLVLLALGFVVYFHGARTGEPVMLANQSLAKSKVVKSTPLERTSFGTKGQVMDAVPAKSPTQMTDLTSKLFGNESVQTFLQTWQTREKGRTRYVPTHLGRGNKVLVLIPPVSAEEKTELQKSVFELVAVIYPDLPLGDREMMQAAVLKWIAPHEFERVIEVSYFVSTDHKYESLSGRWFDVEDSTKFKDEYQYMDFGKIIADGRLPKERLMERYGHLFSIQEEPLEQ